MGGRGSKSSRNSGQLTLEGLQKRAEIQIIIAESNDLRATQLGDIMNGTSGGNTQHLLKCACCEQYTLQPDIENEQCSICGWINDQYQNNHPDSPTGKNPVSLNQARLQWRNYMN